MTFLADMSISPQTVGWLGGHRIKCRDQREGPTAMPSLSPDVGAHLLKATRSQDLDEAFEKSCRNILS